jgi:hypothetical protein
MYMDQTYGAATTTVYELGLHLFQVTVWEHYGVQPSGGFAVANYRGGTMRTLGG